MPDATIEANEGYLSVEIRQPPPLAPVVVELDLFEASNAYAVIHAEHADVVARGAAWVAWLSGKGVPPVSHGAAFRLAGTVTAAVEAFAKKKPGIVWESVASPASTGSPCST